MFSFLNNGNINNVIRTITTNLPGLTTSDGDKIKYAALNYATAMRHNLHNGVPIFTDIRSRDAEIEKQLIEQQRRQKLHSTTTTAAAATTVATATNIHRDNSLFPDKDIHCDNATFALIMAKELAFLNRTIEMVSLVACRYQEEQEDTDFDRRMTRINDDAHDEANNDDDDDDDDEYIEDDTVSSQSPSGAGILYRSHSSHNDNENHPEDYRGRAPENQLVATFLIASGRLQTNFTNLCELVGTSIVVVNAMTTIDQPPNQANREKQIEAEKLVISSIYTEFCRCGPEQRDPIVTAFIELRDISVYAWRIMSMMAFSNLFRLTAGTKFAIHHQHPDDAIFTQGREYGFPSQQAAEVYFHGTSSATTTTTTEQEEEVPMYE